MSFRCPVCSQELKKEEKIWVCPQGHTFDIAAKGYVNLLMSNSSGAKRHGDDRLMINARRDFLSKGFYTPLREAVQAFVESTQEYVTGEVKFKLYKGNIIKAGTTSPYSLYNESLASFTTGDMYDHHDADGFITLFGLPLKVRALMMQEVKNNNK